MNKSDFLGIRGTQVLLDTNIIMELDGSPKDVREALLSFANNNDVCICDTVLYELLRNLNAKRFRERHALIRKAGFDCLSEGTPAVKAMYERINWLYLSILHNEPWNFLHRRQDDLWIIAAGLANGMLHFLTTDDTSDFLSNLFETKKYDLGAKRKFCLHKFQNDKAILEWNKLARDERLTLSLPCGYLKKIKEESWQDKKNRGAINKKISS